MNLVGLTKISEAVLITGNMLFNLFQGIKVFEDSILKHSVELVLNARENGILFVDIEANLLEWGIPVKLVQVK